MAKTKTSLEEYPEDVQEAYKDAQGEDDGLAQAGADYLVDTGYADWHEVGAEAYYGCSRLWFGCAALPYGGWSGPDTALVLRGSEAEAEVKARANRPPGAEWNPRAPMMTSTVDGREVMHELGQPPPVVH